MKRTQAATETLMRRTDDRAAERLRARGWVVFDPETVEKIGRMPVVLAGDPDDGHALPVDPCANGCSNPAMHAEGGHDA